MEDSYDYSEDEIIETINKQFQFNEDEQHWTVTLQLEDGYMARIFFYDAYGEIKKINYRGTIWNVALAIGRTKKEINNWCYGTAPTSLSMLPTYKKYGAKVMLWAKKQVEDFINFQVSRCAYSHPFAIAISGADNRRHRIYKRYCDKNGYKTYTVFYPDDEYKVCTDGERFQQFVLIKNN